MMPDERRIVVGFDGSEHAQCALEWAISRARTCGAALEIVHVWQLPDFNGFGSSSQTLKLLQHHAHDVLDNALESSSGKGVEVTGRTVGGSPAAVLLDACKSADMLVVGARSHGGIAGILTGSTTDQCLHHTTVPIAVVREQPRGEHHASRIVVGVDGSDTSERALAWAVDEARRAHAAVTAVHAWNFVLAGGLPPVYCSTEELEHVSQAVLKTSLGAVDTTGVERVDTASACGPPVTVILDAAKDADLVVVGSRGRGGFASLLLGSTSTKIVHAATTNLVIIPPAGS